jgi:Spy/CpxP family protein refolding chaperone
MFHRYRTVIVSALVVALLAGGGMLYAQRQGGPGPDGRGPGGFARGAIIAGLRSLDLSDAQQQQVREIAQRHRDQMRTAGEGVAKALDAQRAAVETVPTNEGLIRSTTQALAEAQTEMALLQSQVHSEIFSILTPEQQDKAKQLREQRESRFRALRERRQQRL